MIDGHREQKTLDQKGAEDGGRNDKQRAAPVFLATARQSVTPAGRPMYTSSDAITSETPDPAYASSHKTD